MKRFGLIDYETGELIDDNFKISTFEDRIRARTFHERNLASEEFKEYQSKELGDFVFFIFKNIDKLTEILNDSELVRYIYIGTYVKNDGLLKMDNNLSHINKDKLKELLNTSTRTFKNFYDKLIFAGLLTEEKFVKYELIDGKSVEVGEDETRLRLKINFEYTYKGRLSEYKRFTGSKMTRYTRLYVNKIRELYINTDGRSIRKLSIAYKLLPFISWKHNILCLNPEECDHKMLQLLTLGDIMKYLGYDKSNVTRFKSDFYSLRSNNDYIFMSLQKGTPDYLQSIIAVNPKFMYGGNDISEVEWLIKSFDSGNSAKKSSH